MNRKISTITNGSLTLIVLVLSMSVAVAQPRENIEAVGRLGLPTTLDMELAIVKDGYFYGATERGILTVDVRDPRHPHPLPDQLLSLPEDYSLPGCRFLTTGDYCVLLARNELVLIDLSTPGRPGAFEHGTFFRSDWNYRAIAVNRDTLYFCDENLLTIYCLTRGPDLVPLGQIRLSGRPSAASYFDGLLAVSYTELVFGDTTGVQIFDVADPAHPSLVYQWISSEYSARSSENVEMGPGFCVLYQTYEDWPDYFVQFQVLDIRDLRRVRLTGTFDAELDKMFRNGSDVMFSTENGVNILDISDPAHPRIVREMDLALCPQLGDHWAFAQDEERLYLGYGVAFLNSLIGFSVHDISNPDSTLKLGSFCRDGYANQIEVRGNLAAISQEASGVTLVDISNPAAPVEASSWATPQYPTLFFQNDTVLLVASNWGGIIGYDVSDPVNPVEIGSGGTDSTGICFAFQDQLVYEACRAISGIPNIRIYNAANLAQIEEIASVELDYLPEWMKCERGRLYVSRNNDISVFDVSNPAEPSLLATSRIQQEIVQPMFAGDQMFGVNRNREWVIRYNISNPDHISRDSDWAIHTLTQSVNYSFGMKSISLHPDREFFAVADGAAGVRLFYIGNDFANGWESGYFDTPGTAYDMAMSEDGSKTYVANGDALWILDINAGLEVDGAHALLPDELSVTVSPNPFNSSTLIHFALPRPTNLRLAVFDLSGKEVALLVEGRSDAGRHEITWDASTFPSGLYLLRLDSPEFHSSRKLVLVR